MEFRSNKGYVMTDISIAVIILLILVPTIMGLVYNIGINKRATESKSEAINIAVNAIEAAKGISLEDLNEQKILEFLDTNNEIYQYTFADKNFVNKEGTIKTEKASYKLLINVEDFANSESAPENVTPNVIKTVKATVNYRLRGEDQEIELSTVVK